VTAPPDRRRFPPEIAGERATLQGYLDYHRDTLSLRWLYGHMIEEYARHNGHADLIREAIDGATGE
jgi:hypothetical protein